MPKVDEITKILDARLERESALIVLKVRHAGSADDWIMPMSVEAASDMVKRVSSLLSEHGLM